MYSKIDGNSRKNRKTIVCPNCGRTISCPSSKKCTILIKCRPCREAERKYFMEMIREIICSEKDSNQTVKDAIREYLKNPNSINITATRKKRYRYLKWQQQTLQEKNEIGISNNQHDLNDVKIVSNLILRIYGLEDDEIKNLTRTWRKKIRLLANEIVARRAFMTLEKRRSNLKHPYIKSLHRQMSYKKVIFMLCG